MVVPAKAQFVTTWKQFNPRQNCLHSEENMKTTIHLIVPALAVLLLASGCSKNEEPPAPSTPEARKTTDSAMAEAANAVTKSSEALKQAAEKTQAEAQRAVEQSQAIGAAATEKAQALLDSAKKLADQNNWSEVMSVLQQLANVKLTPEQQQLVDDLKKQAQQHLTRGAGEKALDGLLKK